MLASIAIGFASETELLWATFRYVGLIFGGMLGVFLLGVTTRRRGNDIANPIAMVTSIAALILLKMVQEQSGQTFIAWPWWVVIGTAWTFAIGACFPTRTRRA